MNTLTQTSESLLRHVVPIFYDAPNGKLQSFGTGFLVDFNGASYLVTAGHVINSVADPRLLVFYIGKRQLRNLFGSTRTTVSHKPDHSDDRLDIGVVKIEGAGAPPYPDIDKEAINFSKLEPAEPYRQLTYLVTGFPGSKGGFRPDKREIISKSYAPLTKSVSSPDRTKNDRLELFFDKNRVYNNQGQKITFPKPQGMSGSPVWLLKDNAQPGTYPHTVAGVLVEYHSNSKLFIATNISVVIDIIKNAFD